VDKPKSLTRYFFEYILMLELAFPNTLCAVRRVERAEGCFVLEYRFLNKRIFESFRRYAVGVFYGNSFFDLYTSYPEDNHHPYYQLTVRCNTNYRRLAKIFIYTALKLVSPPNTTSPLIGDMYVKALGVKLSNWEGRFRDECP
jgi:hypothetical protein